MAITETQLIIRQMTIAALNAAGGFGLVLIAYGTGVAIDPSWNWPLLDRYAPFISTVLTLTGTFCTAASVRFPVHARPFDTHSRKVIAPFVCLLVLGAFGYLCLGPGKLPDNVINGFAILGLVGALFRLLPFSEEPGLKQ